MKLARAPTLRHSTGEAPQATRTTSAQRPATRAVRQRAEHATEIPTTATAAPPKHA